VATRSYAITSGVGGRGFDLYSDIRSQMYRGVSAETPSTDAAVAATRGQVVTYKGVPVVTYFFNSSGGHTENIEDVWPRAAPEPWLGGVPDPYDGAGGDPYHRWGYQMATTVAAAKLGGLVKGRLVGINVLTHGSSPRILLAQVVGTGGRTTVTGIQLQHVFGLLTTYAAFRTISTLPSPLSPAPAGSERTAHTGADAILALVPLIRELVAGPARGIHGTVFPARRGEQVRVQREASGRWHMVATTRLAVGGAYGVALSASGTYRVLYNGLDGPAVSVP